MVTKSSSPGDVHVHVNSCGCVRPSVALCCGHPMSTV